MDHEQVLREGLIAAELHVKAVRRVTTPLFSRLRRAAVSGTTVPRAEISYATTLARELEDAELRAERLRQAAGLRAEC